MDEEAISQWEKNTQCIDECSLQDVFEKQCMAFRSETYPSIKVRKDRLDRLSDLLLTNQKTLIEAVFSDFGYRAEHETRLAEIMASVQSIHYMKSNLRKWMRKRSRTTAKWFLPARNFLFPQPLGVVGIMAPWNYPINLAVAPAATAIAAGNRVLLRMSEHTPATTELFASLVKSKFDKEELAIFGGNAEFAQSFSSLPLDHLFFTGSTAVGRHVMKAAAENLTPVTLELGGKSPVIISEEYPILEAAERIAWGKGFNAGQTCIAPDYIFLPEGRVPEFVKAYQKFFKERYSANDWSNYTSIVNAQFYNRLKTMILEAHEKGAQIYQFEAHSELGEKVRKLLPTIIVNPPDNSRVMTEEIFGPILPIITYSKRSEVIDKIQTGPRPLALYYFTKNSDFSKQVLQETHSGGVTMNDVLIQFVQEDRPFGGVGASGMGRYHGPEGFDTFSHLKPVCQQRGLAGFTGIKLLYPPHGKLADFMIKLMGG